MADKAGVGYATVARFEAGGTIADSSRAKLEQALQGAGAQFSDWRDRVGVTVTRKSTATALAEAKPALGKVRKAIRQAEAGSPSRAE